MKSFIQAFVWPAVFAVVSHVAALIVAIAGGDVALVTALSIAGVTSAVLATRAR